MVRPRLSQLVGYIGLVAGGAGGSADGDRDLGAGRGAVEVDQGVAGAVGPVAVGVAVGGRGGVLVGLFGGDVDVVLVAGGVVGGGVGRARSAGSRPPAAARR